MLYIHLLGHLRLFQDECPHPFAALPKTLPLWAYLLLNRARPVPRDTLAFLLWPDRPETVARGNLRRHLYDLRQALPPAEQGRPWVLSQAGTVQWNPAADYWLDTAEFERLSTSHDHLARAVALYTGDLLPDLYEDWIVLDREQLRNIYLSNLSQLVVQSRARGDTARAMNYARELLVHDPLREDAVRELISLRYQAGDRAGALQAYQRFEQLLQEQLGESPMPETRALYAAVIQSVPLPEVLPEALPPAEDAFPHNLPAVLNACVGRAAEIMALRDRLTQNGSRVRLLTLTGPAGVGKTRLALETATGLLSDQASTFPDGIFFVDLSSISEPDLVLSAIAETVGVEERGSRSLLESLRNFLHSKYMLLLLDNFEHVIEAGPQIVDLLAAAPDLRVLVTSRTALRVYGEHENPVQPLPLPDLEHLPFPQDLSDNAAVSLFIARARERKPSFALVKENAAAVAEVCVRLDGLPLAIELAASRIKIFSPDTMLVHLTNRLAFLTDSARDLPPRHRTLRGAIDWSYNLLDEDEKSLFALLGVFAGGCTLAAAEAVCEPFYTGDIASGLSSLLDKSLIHQFEQDAPSRFGMVSTIREYALEKLAASRRGDVVHRHYAGYYLALAGQAEQALKGPEQLAWLKRLETEHDNLRAVLGWAIAGEGERAILGLQLAGTLALFWQMRGYWTEGYGWVRSALAKCEGASTSIQAKALLAAGTLLFYLWRFEQAAPYLQQSLALYRQMDDQSGVADALYWLGCQAFRSKRYREATEWIEQSLALYREVNNHYGVSRALRNLGDCARLLQNYERSSRLYEQGLALSRQIGNHQNIATALNSLGELARFLGDFDRAKALYEEALSLLEESGSRSTRVAVLHNLGHATLRLGNPERAAALFHDGLALAQKLEYSRGVVLCLAGSAGVASSLGRAEQAASLLGKAAAMLEASKAPLPLGPADQVAYDEHVAATKAQLDPQAFAAAWEAGQQMTLSQAIAAALGLKG